MAGLTVPIITVLLGEGGENVRHCYALLIVKFTCAGSGGALGIGMGNIIGMLSGGYFGVISPEGAASILGRYKSAEEKAIKFPLDCQALATSQCIYAYQLKELGVVDEIIWESIGENFNNFPILKSRLTNFIASSLLKLEGLTKEELVIHRYNKFRTIGIVDNFFSLYSCILRNFFCTRCD